MPSPPSKKMKVDTSFAASLKDTHSATSLAGSAVGDNATETSVDGELEDVTLSFPRRAFVEDVSLDILLEVFTHLHPQDLLNLSRTSKTFRGFLMNRRSALAWKEARVRTSNGAPACPPHLSEPRYAILLFTQWCTVCGGSADAQLPFWAFYGRYCSSCVPKRVVKWSTIQQFLSDVSEAAGTGLEGMFLRSVSRRDECRTLTTVRWFYFPAVVHFKYLWRRASLEQRRQLIKANICSVNKWAEDTKAITAWGAKEDERLMRYRQSKVEARRHSILARLKEEGWSKELAEGCPRCYHDMPGFNKVEPLTESDFTDMREHLIAPLEVKRDARLRKEKIQLYGARISRFHRTMQTHPTYLGVQDPASDTRATFSDLVLRPACRQLLDAPASQNVTEGDFLALVDALQEDWLDARKREFEALVPKDRVEVAECPLLSLAIISFRCSCCRRNDLRWPNVLAHPCARDPSQPFLHLRRYTDSLEEALNSACGQLRLEHPWREDWSPFRVVFPSKKAYDLARACGYDPGQVTYEVMQRKRFYCKICATPKYGYMEVYDWENTYLHEQPRCALYNSRLQLSLEDKVDKWAILDDEHTKLVLATEAALEAAGDIPDGIYGCTRCRYHADGLHKFHKHCRSVHGVDKPRKSLNREDFYLHPDNCAGAHHTITIYPEDARGDRTADKDVLKGHAFFSTSLFSQ
ncbi:hypothetical protein C2E23DRAFT_1583 [Lenzites betulinus]|nr:hypothetical protein C2E23DRAFT_1583 [Lenzites betulinus]